MKIIPAIDLMDGNVVRLVQGLPERLKSYAHLGDPVTFARRWEKERADAIHIIDLNAALERGNNLQVVLEIARSVEIPIQVGGGIRNLDLAIKLLNSGISKIILGSLVFKKPNQLKILLKDFDRERIVVALDHRKDEVMIHGWKSTTNHSIDSAMEYFLDLGINFFLVTSIIRDGTLRGPDYTTLTRISDLKAKILAAGGIRSLEDISLLKKIGVYGVVIGKALYEAKINLQKALEIAGKDPNP